MPEHAKRIKLRRKDLRQPDEFETLTGQALDVLSAHRTLVATVVAIVVVVALGLVILSQWRASQNETASAEFRAAHQVYAANRHSEAAQAFANLAEDFPRTPSGRLARLYRAHALAAQGDAAGAATAYAEYLAVSPQGGYLRQEALVGLGRAREATNDAPGALEVYTEASQLDGPFQRDALLGAARLHEAGGRVAEAQAIYARLMKESPDPELRAFLASKLPPGSAGAADGAPQG